MVFGEAENFGGGLDHKSCEFFCLGAGVELILLVLKFGDEDTEFFVDDELAFCGSDQGVESLEFFAVFGDGEGKGRD